ncbi:tRNA-specific 2-thiouridylase MnmA [Candidatus Arsenophonus lipoptenae]|uniref:tRNA-specific 2-thiouridylase MnmA n=1 Tax=Candidatus Arsenophonus lipoptenae TaxID=634113 RepID=A0A0X9W3J7_9GAMM|nr:tRNA 2-thiouridine(34) synthase MnmA [Candidatus Arsenophonus lipoptenae]AMA65089.1 tRNA-specific 2-thiouridylase MnmA [Candidatus Arsenophonus lipoptenae]
MFNNKSKKVIVSMSGGVDSSVCAYLIKQKGYQVAGLFMKNWEENDNEEYCSVAIDLADAQSVCNKLNIQLYTVNFSAEYWDHVFTNFLDEYKSGRTPNPDILCNKEIKFKAFLEFSIKNLKADYIATGHYVRSKTTANGYQLLRGIDHNKDQSYFLYTLNQTQLAHSIFPIGNFKKSTVRSIATKIGLKTANKKDSTGICFIGKYKFRKFLSNYLSNQPGKIITVNGQILGEHKGLMYHTLGQRKGLGIGGIKSFNEAPWYVVDKDIENNYLIVAQDYNHSRLRSIGFIIRQMHWITLPKLHKKGNYTVKTRYRQPDIPCTIQQESKDKMIIFFNYPVAAVTPGQSAVFYQDEICLGGGVIEKLIK